jgi:pantoate--beta-alanine ligase
MKTITTIKPMQHYADETRIAGKTIGFVPTMGYLHEGHISLIKAAKTECDVTVVSIFVNPTQFAPGEDFEKYPRDMKKDIKILEDNGVDVLFSPEVNDMYLPKSASYVGVGGSITEGLCALSRPGHFIGVTTVVAKLFNSVKPSISYFGQKDAQQAVVIKKMADDLNFDTDIKVLPLIREKDGLVMSSRNKYLSDKERRSALSIYHSLTYAEQCVKEGETSCGKITEDMFRMISGEGLKVDYIEIVDPETLMMVEDIGGTVLIAVAAYCGDTRLIDNVIIGNK